MNFAKLVNLAMDCEFGNAVAKLAKWFANLAMGCEFGNVVCEIGNVVCEVGNVVCEIGNAKFR